MLKSLLLKELRENYWIALVALGLSLFVVAKCIYDSSLPGLHNGEEVPFLDGQFVGYFDWISIALAIALGFRQTIGESHGGTFLFLLHRPMNVKHIVAMKLLAGLCLYLACGFIAISSYIAWAAVPGIHPGPFFWWMTVDTWTTWGLIFVVYLCTFLTGIRPGRWFGTRLLPLIAAGPLDLLLFFAFKVPVLGVVVFLLVTAYLVGLIQFTARTRDYS